MRVVELFAGVGGFRLGLEGWEGHSCSSRYKEEWKSPYKVIWSNQWEPSTKTQHASDVYVDRFGETGHVNKDISTIEPSDIPEHDLLVGGFPCQDYSVASSLKNSKGIEGKKGVLWWEIHRLLEGMTKRPKHILLENVDRLLSSPSKQKGRDFAIILSSLSNLGYSVEWMVIDPSLYGMPQKRKRVFILGHLNDIETVLDKAFPSAKELYDEFTVESDILSVSDNFNKGGKKSPFSHYGTVADHHVRTYKITSTPTKEQMTLGSVLLEEKYITEDFYIPDSDLSKWLYLKGSKNEKRVTKDGFEYNYTEGGMTFPDRVDRPSRTIITGEGGKSPSRFKHVVCINGRYRRLTPVELERLSMFPDGHTRGVPDTKRAFLIGNALVAGVVEQIGRKLIEQKVWKRDLEY